MAKYLDRLEQSAYLRDVRGVKYTKKTLQKLATTGGGPKYVLLGGRALSTAPWLDEWVDELVSAPRRSTSEVAA